MKARRSDAYRAASTSDAAVAGSCGPVPAPAVFPPPLPHGFACGETVFWRGEGGLHIEGTTYRLEMGVQGEVIGGRPDLGVWVRWLPVAGYQSVKR